ncbi:MAG: SelB C-terminal domain-containing protein, partial [Xanthomonadales bacterium]|nr:SelB C-terminal domain-containing protein [Xanthomonadales bacterium]
ALDTFHGSQPDEAGIDSARLRRLVAPTLAAAIWRALVDALVVDGALVRHGAWLHRPGHRVEPDADERALLDRLHPLLVAGRFDPPWVRDLAAKVGIDEERVRRSLRKASVLGEVHQVVRDLFYARECVDELAAIVRTLAGDAPLEAARLRDALGLGRKRTIQLLEYLDRVGYTRRVRDAHVLRGDGGGMA